MSSPAAPAGSAAASTSVVESAQNSGSQSGSNASTPSEDRGEDVGFEADTESDLDGSSNGYTLSMVVSDSATLSQTSIVTSESSAAFINSSQAGVDNELPVLSQQTDQGADLAVDAAPEQGMVNGEVVGDDHVLEASDDDAEEAPAQPVEAEQDEDGGDMSDASQV
ncbi:hypothetical protein OC842_007874, partial [Tilletia horrida]